MGKWSFIPAAVGFWVGILFLLLLDHVIPHLHRNTDEAEGPKSRLQKTTMLVLAVTLHNIPEGMAVGVVYAGYLMGSEQITVLNLDVVKVDSELGLIAVRGAIPGPKGGLVYVKNTAKTIRVKSGTQQPVRVNPQKASARK